MAGLSVCIHRGAAEIGGSCVELRSDGESLVLDVGLPLDPEGEPQDLLPRFENPVRAIVVSHGHMDHWGLAPFLEERSPLVMGAATQRIMAAAAPFVPKAVALCADHLLEDRRSLTLGPFRVTPYLVDHSAYDAYALVVEAGGRRLFYSGDLRSHGRKGALFQRLLRDPPADIDVMLMEGSSLGRIGADEAFPSEVDIETRLTDLFSDKERFFGVCASAQNIDRVVSIYRACKRTGRTLLVDLYAASILAATGNENIPKPGWPLLKVYIPEYQRRHIKRNALFHLLDPVRPHRVFSEELQAMAGRAVMLFRPPMKQDIARLDLWSRMSIVWSQWDGYLAKDPARAFKAEVEAQGAPFNVVHTSGHASVADLTRLARAVSPKALVPIHTFRPQDFEQHFERVNRRKDGEWWDVE